MKNLLIIILVSITSFTFGQEAILTGVVKLKYSNQSIADINVFTDAGSLFTTTNAHGKYHLELPVGKYKITYSGIGFKTVYADVEATAGTTVEKNIELQEEIFDLPVVEVNAYSSTGGMMGSLDLPGSAHYISSREFKALNTTNPNAILERIPGIQLQEEDGFGLRPNIGLRGSGAERSSKITIMEDGILAAPAPYAAPSAYYFPTMARMSGVEVLKGSSQIVHGPYTTGGSINMLSTPIPSTLQGRVSMGAGSFGSRNLQAQVGNQQGNVSYLLETFQYSAEGFKTIDFSDNETGFDKKDYLAKLRFTTDAGARIFQSLQLKIGESREHSDETYLGLNYEDFLQDPYRRYAGSQEDEMNTQHRQLSLTHIIAPKQNLYIQTSAYRNTFDRNWYKLDKVYGEEGSSAGIAELLDNRSQYANAYSLISGRTSQGEEALSVKANNRSYLSKGLQTRIQYSAGQHDIELGVRYHYDEMDRYQWVDKYRMEDGTMLLTDTGQEGTESNRIESATALAAYIQYQFIRGNWTVTAGSRMENIEIRREDYGKSDPDRTGSELKTRGNEVTAFIPGVSLQYNLDASQQLFAGVHRGFAPPGSLEGTKPELSVNYELGYRIEKSNFFGSVTGFVNDYSNLLGSDLASSGGVGSGDQFNGGDSRVYGLETSLTYRKPVTDNLWMPWQVQYTFSQATFQNDFTSDFEPWGTVVSGDHLPYLANHTLHLSTGLSGNKWSLNLGGNYTSFMRTHAGQGSVAEREKIPGRFLLSANMMYRLSKNVDLNVGVHNVTDKQYAVASRPAGWRPGAPRNIVLRMDARF